MLRSVLLLIIGAALGAAAAWIAGVADRGGSSSAEQPPSLLRSVAGFANGRGEDVPAAAGVAEHAAAYAAAQSLDSYTALTSALARAAEAAASPARDLEIDALLARLSELDPASSVRLAFELGLDPPFVVAAYVLWAEADQAAALAGLNTIDNATLRRETALALLAVVGDDSTGAERIALALSPAERDSFRMDWLSARAAYASLAAFRDAQAIGNPGLRTRAIQTVAQAWARIDPAGLLQQADSVSDLTLARTIRSVAYGEWARADPGAFADYVESVVQVNDEMYTGLQFVLASDPDRVMRLADRLPLAMGQALAGSAIRALALTDPDGAKARVASMAPGQQRDTAVQSIASALAQSDPEAALEWVQALSPPDPDALRTVMLALAASDPVRALELVDLGAGGIESQMILSSLTSRVAQDPAKAREMADLLARRNDIQSTATLQRLVANWMQRDPESALDWALQHSAQLDASAFGTAAQALAQQDPQQAIEYIDRIPERHRTAWITQTASAYGRLDPAAALNWINRFQGQPVHDLALREILRGVAQADPVMAAQALSQASPAVQSGSAGNVAAQWSQQDPRAAASWASGLTDPQARRSALTTAIGSWAGSDRNAARRWVLELAPDETRDQALNTLIMRAAGDGVFDRELLAGIRSPVTRQQALQTAIVNLARTDPDRASEVLAREVTDDAQRAQIEQTIQRQLEQQNALQIQSSGNLILLR